MRRARKRKVRCRCRNCGARNTKSGELKYGLARARCRNCLKTGTLRIDKWADARGWLIGRCCRCNGVPFPHRPKFIGMTNHCGADILVWCHSIDEAGYERIRELEQSARWQRL